MCINSSIDSEILDVRAVHYLFICAHSSTASDIRHWELFVSVVSWVVGVLICMHSSTDSGIRRFGVLIFITIDLHIHHHLTLSPHAPHAATQMCDTCCRLIRPARPTRRHRCVTLAVASCAPRAPRGDTDV